MMRRDQQYFRNSHIMLYLTYHFKNKLNSCVFRSYSGESWISPMKLGQGIWLFLVGYASGCENLPTYLRTFPLRTYLLIQQRRFLGSCGWGLNQQVPIVIYLFNFFFFFFLNIVSITYQSKIY
uniref:Uncharacterized protein n=1 Tax=Cacopsylla melanoneura TaxID=428564 RepID=A0A8D8T6L5_9HEMI